MLVRPTASRTRHATYTASVGERTRSYGGEGEGVWETTSMSGWGVKGKKRGKWIRIDTLRSVLSTDGVSPLNPLRSKFYRVQLHYKNTMKGFRFRTEFLALQITTQFRNKFICPTISCRTETETRRTTHDQAYDRCLESA